MAVSIEPDTTLVFAPPEAISSSDASSPPRGKAASQLVITNQEATAAVLFSVKTTSPATFTAQPSKGVLQPGTSTTVAVYMAAPFPAKAGAALAGQCMLQTVAVEDPQLLALLRVSTDAAALVPSSRALVRKRKLACTWHSPSAAAPPQVLSVLAGPRQVTTGTTTAAARADGAAAAPGRAYVVSSTPVHTDGFRWVGLRKLTYMDPAGTLRQWEACERTTRMGVADATVVVGLIRSWQGRPAQIVLVSQFRPPVNGTVVEMPAGLIDMGETPEEAALRELREETGYVGTVVSSSPVVPSDPGMTSASMVFVTVDIDPSLAANASPVSEQEDGEFITVHTVALPELLSTLTELQATRNWHIDSRLYTFALRPLADSACAGLGAGVVGVGGGAQTDVGAATDPPAPACPVRGVWCMPAVLGIPACAIATALIVGVLLYSHKRR